MRNSKRRILSLALALALTVGTLAACGNKPAAPSGSAPAGSQPAAPKKDTIVIATANETPSLNPYDHNAVAGSYMNQLTHNALFKTDMQLNVVPDLVDTYKNVTDTVWEFKLKPGIKFHDGSTMTSADVKASLDYAKTFPVVGQYTKDVGECTVVDDLTFTLTTKAPYANLLMDLTHHGNQIVPKALIEKGNDFNKNPIGSGPYKFVKWTMGEKLDFVKFDDYFDKDAMPTITNMTWKIIPEGASRTIALEAGEIDIIIEVESMDAKRIEENQKLSLLKVASTSHNFMMLNNEVKPFDNQLLRKAMNAAIDKEAVAEVALNGLGVVANAQVPMGLPGYSDKNATTYNVEQAKAWMKESGVDPASVKLPIICSDDTKRRAGEVIQANLRDVLGINAELVSMDLATYLSKTAEGDYIAAIGGFTSSSILGYVKGVWHSNSINASNKTRMNNKDVDALIDKAGLTLDADARNKILEELSALLNDLCGQVPTYQPQMLRAFNKDLGGVECSPSGTLYFNKVFWK